MFSALPQRVHNVVSEIVSALRSRNLPVRPSAFTLSSIRSLFPPMNAFSPGPLVSAFYPHLRSQPHALALSVPRISMQAASLRGAKTLASSWFSLVETAATAPLTLTAQECALKRDSLRKLRDARAVTLGELLLEQSSLDRAVREATDNHVTACDSMTRIVSNLQQKIDSAGHITRRDGDLAGHLSILAMYSVPAQRATHIKMLQSNSLVRPSYLTRAWPRLLLYPPLIVYALKTAYGSREAWSELASTALDTADRFWHDWLLEPLRGVVKTVRAGSEQGVIVNAKGVAADIDVRVK
jgi:nuclear-control-of-ATPase protein 2